MTSENDLVFIQAAKHLGSLSQRRPALQDLTNLAAQVEKIYQTPLSKKARLESDTLAYGDTLKKHNPYRDFSEEANWLKMGFPKDLGTIRELQAQQGHLFHIKERRVSHVGIIPQLTIQQESPMPKSRKRTPKKRVFTFKNFL